MCQYNACGGTWSSLGNWPFGGLLHVYGEIINTNLHYGFAYQFSETLWGDNKEGGVPLLLLEGSSATETYPLIDWFGY